jgi:hypothetical protein
MKKLAIAVLAATPLFAAPLFAEEPREIDFSDPTVVFSSVEVVYGSEGFGLGYGLAGELNDEWATLTKFEAKEDFDVFRARAAFLTTTTGTGVMFDYIWDTDFADAGADSHTLVANFMQVLPIGEKMLFVPLVGGGFTTNDFSDNSVALASIQAMMVYNWTPSIWTNVIPQYTYGFNDMKMKSGSKTSIRSFDLEVLAGYRFLGTQNVKVSYKRTNDDDNQGWVAYTYAF